MLDAIEAVLAAFGGGVLIVAGLSKWIAELTSKRILQHEQGLINTSLERFKGELALDKLSYERHVSDVVEYYEMVYKSYQMCQRVARADVLRHPTKGDTNTREEYLEHIDGVSDQWHEKQARVRLLLPTNILEIHDRLLERLNEFNVHVKKGIQGTEEYSNNIKKSFGAIHEVKAALEVGLRAYLRRDKI